MPKICNHTSVGMIVERDGKILLIERAKFPKGFACPAGHLDDGEDYEVAAKRELVEEVGLEEYSLGLLLDKRAENPCRREGGTWHHWKIFKVEATGEVKRSLEETKNFGWYEKDDIQKLAAKTQDYINGKITEEEWDKDPGLEPVWYDWFKELDIIKS